MRFLRSNLGVGEIKILEELDNSGSPVNISELASKFNVGISTIRGCLDNLKEHRYVESSTVVADEWKSWQTTNEGGRYLRSRRT